MNRKTSISGYQYFCMIFLFEIGSTSLVGITPEVKQDAWISLIISLFIGCIVFYIQIKLFAFFPEYLLTKYVQFILGKYAGKILAMIYIIFFIYIAGRILRDLEDLLTMTLFTASSLISIGILMLFVVIYGLFKGIETFARTTEFLFLFIIMFILLIFGFEFISNVYQINNLRPVLENILLGFILSPWLLSFFTNTNITYNFLIDLIGIIYLMLLPATKLQGTIGKVTVGIKVINKDGSKLSVFEAISRWLAQVVASFILFIGYIMIAFSNRKTALHDKLANTYVVYK